MRQAILCFFILGLVQTSCTHNCGEFYGDQGIAKGDLNERSWTSCARTSIGDFADTYFIGFSSKGHLIKNINEEFSISNLPDEVGEYILTNDTGEEQIAVRFNLIDYDILLATYVLSPSTDNRISVTSYDLGSRSLKGELNLTFEKDVEYQTLEDLDLIVLSNVEFNVKLAE